MARHGRLLDTAEYSTTETVRFERSVLPALSDLGVIVENLRHIEGAGELHVTLYLPSHDRAVREKTLCVLQDFERAYAHTVTVSPSMLYAEDRDVAEDTAEGSRPVGV